MTINQLQFARSSTSIPAPANLSNAQPHGAPAVPPDDPDAGTGVGARLRAGLGGGHSHSAGRRLGWRTRAGGLLRASGGTRYLVAIGVDALGAGLLRPFLLLYGVKVLGLSVTGSGLVMSVGMVFGLAAVPLVGRWLDRGARSSAVAASMLVRVLGVALLLAAADIGPNPVWGFTAASLFLGIGNQCWPPAHAAVVTTVADPRDRDAALAAGRSLRNAGLGAGALIAMAALSGGTNSMRALAVATLVGYAVAAGLAWSLRITDGTVGGANAGTGADIGSGAATEAIRARRIQIRIRVRIRSLRPTITTADLAVLPYSFLFNVLEVALPAVLVIQLHASAAWSAGVFVGNTVIVVVAQVGVVIWMARHARRTMVAVSGFVLALSYLGFWAAASLGPGDAAAAGIALVSVLYTAGEIMYSGSVTALIVETTAPQLLGRALARYQLTSGIGVALSPAVLMFLLARGEAALWGTLAVATVLAAIAVARQQKPAAAAAAGKGADTAAGTAVTSTDRRAVPEPALGS